MEDVWHDVEFYLAIRLDEEKGVASLYQAWRRKPDKDLPASVKVLKVKLEMPESMWRLPILRGKMKSDLKEEYDLFLEEMEG